MNYYINFYYTNLSYNENMIRGHFNVLECDGNVDCDFYYDRTTGKTEVYNSNKPLEEIEHIPVYWLISKLEKDGFLPKNTSKISI